jgi:hypothetical protein
MIGGSAILYGYETIRGGLVQINRLSYNYTNYLMIDWSSFDQSVPYTVIETFFTTFLPSLLVVNHYYSPISNYTEATHHDTYLKMAETLHSYERYKDIPLPELATLIFATKISNLLKFTWKWYQNMVIISPDGIPYFRTNAGVLSGFLNTQYLDSYANLFIMIYSMLSYGFTPLQIQTMLFFILGDDNICFSNLDTLHMESFFLFLPQFTKTQFGTTLSPSKSLFTRLRSKIEVLGYRNSEGRPRRNIEKLIAQLAYPERHTNDLINMHRAIGYAWAASGQDPVYHNLCQQVFIHYRDKTLQMRSDNPELYKLLKFEQLAALYAEIQFDESVTVTSRIKFTLPGPIQALLALGQPIPALDTFPSIYDITNEYESWKGFLGSEQKWDSSYFTSTPYSPFEDNITLSHIYNKYGRNFELNLAKP